MPFNEPKIVNNEQAIVVVSGLPRSGTSMMMAMLEAGGLKLLVDHARKADRDNPNGYFEFDPVKKIAKEQTWLPAARGRAVKIVSLLLPELPANFFFKIIFMRRALPEVLASQRRMLERRGESASHDDEKIRQLYEKHLLDIGEWMAAQPHIEVLYVDYADTLSNPVETARRVNAFLNHAANLEVMVASVDPSLYRQRV
jgi:hypothetical protein